MNLNRQKMIVAVSHESLHVADGPYVISLATGDVFSVCRLFHDDAQAFIGGSIQYNQEPKSFDWSNIDASTLPIPILRYLCSFSSQGRLAVPSRLLKETSSSKPLSSVI